MRNHTGPVLCFPSAFFLAVEPGQVFQGAGADVCTGLSRREGGFTNESAREWAVVFLGMARRSSIWIFGLYSIER